MVGIDIGRRALHQARGWFGGLVPDDSARTRIDAEEDAIVALMGEIYRK